jgi:hypothetical protein
MKKSDKLFKIIKIALLFCFCLLILAACGSNENNGGEGEGAPPGESGGSEENGGAEQQTAMGRSPNIPSILRFEGQTLRIYEMEQGWNNEFLLEQATNIVDEAIYQKNMRVMEVFRLENIHVTQPLDEIISLDSRAQEIIRLMMADDFEYDLIKGPQFRMVYLTGHEYLANLRDLPYIDITQPWWAGKYIDEITVGDHTRFFLAGDIALEFAQYRSILLYNKKLYGDLINPDNPAELYDVVLAGDWTFDKFSEMVRGVYLNLDGTGVSNVYTDRFGVSFGRWGGADHYFYTQNPRVTTRDEFGIPQVSVQNERSINALQNMRDLFDNNVGAADITNADMHWSVPFIEDRLLFVPNTAFFGTAFLTDMESDYGIIPMPKFDENQTEYYSIPHDASPIFAIPSNAVRVDLIGAFLEEMAYMSFNDVSPVYFNHALKFRYARDASDEASQMIDIIRDGAITDFGYLYGLIIVGTLNDSANNGLGYVQRFIANMPRLGVVTYVDRGLEVWERELAKLVDLYLE